MTKGAVMSFGKLVMYLLPGTVMILENVERRSRLGRETGVTSFDRKEFQRQEEKENQRCNSARRGCHHNGKKRYTGGTREATKTFTPVSFPIICLSRKEGLLFS